MLIEEVFTALRSRRLLVVLDEFSTLQGRTVGSPSPDALTEAVFAFISNIIQKNTQLTFIFTGTYTLLEMMRKHAFDLAKICTPYMVGFLDDDSAHQLVVAPAMRGQNNTAKGWLEYDPRVVDRI